MVIFPEFVRDRPRSRPGLLGLLRLESLRLGRLKPEPAGAALTEWLFQFGEDCLEFACQRPRRVDGQQTRRVPGGARGLPRDAEFQAQIFSPGRGGGGPPPDTPRQGVSGTHSKWLPWGLYVKASAKPAAIRSNSSFCS